MNWWDLISVTGLASLKVWPALFTAVVVHQLNAIEIFFCVFIGSMSGVVFFAFWGTKIKEWLHKRRKASGKPRKINYKRIRRYIKIWRRYGLIGIAVLTPPLLSPPIGTIISVAFGEGPKRIIFYMGVSCIIWSMIFAAFGKVLLDLFN